MHQFSSDEPNLPLSKFEMMLKTNSVYFFDADEFEQIILHYIDNGKNSLANKAIQLGLEQHPGSVTLKLIKVELLLIEDKLEKAENLLDELLEVEPANDEIYIQKATIYSKKGLHKKAVEALKIALQHTDDVVDIYSMLGMEYLFLDDFETARLSFAKCLEVEYDNYSSLYNVIYCYEMLDQHQEAIDYLLQHIDKDPYSEVAWHQLGKQYYTVKNYEKALEAYDYAILIDEMFIGAHLEKAKTLEKLGRLEEAIEFYHITMELDIPTPFVYMRIGKCYEKLDDYDQAFDFYDKAVKEDALFDKAWLALTALYRKTEQLKKALFYIKKAISIDQDNFLFWNELAEINTKLHLFEEAARAYRVSLDLNDADADIYIKLSDIEYFLGKFMLTYRLLADAEKKFPDHSGILYRLAGVAYVLGKTEKALAYLKKALRTNFSYHRSFTGSFPKLFNDSKVISLLEKYENESGKSEGE